MKHYKDLKFQSEGEHFFIKYFSFNKWIQLKFADVLCHNCLNMFLGKDINFCLIQTVLKPSCCHLRVLLEFYNCEVFFPLEEIWKKHDMTAINYVYGIDLAYLMYRI